MHNVTQVLLFCTACCKNKYTCILLRVYGNAKVVQGSAKGAYLENLTQADVSSGPEIPKSDTIMLAEAVFHDRKDQGPHSQC